MEGPSQNPEAEIQFLSRKLEVLMTTLEETELAIQHSTATLSPEAMTAKENVLTTIREIKSAIDTLRQIETRLN